MDLDTVTLLLVATIALAAPLIFASMGELLSEKAGIINIQLEGMMLAGAFCGVWAALATGSFIGGFTGAALGGLAVAATHGILCLFFGAQQVVSGVVLNILVLGLTTYAMGPVFGGELGRTAATLPRTPIPILSDIPFLGPIIFSHNVMVYMALILVAAIWWLVYRTTFGLAIQAAGEAPMAARSMGIDVRRIRWLALLACGMLAGIGGGQLILAGLGTFTQNVTAGRGFIALAAVIFGRWKPAWTLVAVLIFTLTEAIQVRAQVMGIRLPYQFLVMAPYVVTVLALALFMSRSRAPRALGTND